MPAGAHVDETVKWIAIGFQLAGILLALAGVAVVRYWLDAAMTATVEAGRGFGRWLGLRLERLLNRLGKRHSVTAQVELSATVRQVGSLNAEVIHQRVDRKTIGTREWLAFLDDRLEAVRVFADQISARQGEDRERVAEKLEAQQAEIRREILQTARDGWQLIPAGLMLSLIGIVLGGFA
jgi:hypothetical protein